MLLQDSFALAGNIYDSGYRPDQLVVIWRGGAPVGMAIHEFFCYKGIQTRQVIIKAASYSGIGQRNEPRIENIDTVLSVLEKDDDVLIIDDIYDTGSTVQAVRAHIAGNAGNVRIATLYLKKGNTVVPDYYLKEVEGWIVFPHELVDLTSDEIRAKDAYIHALLHGS